MAETADRQPSPSGTAASHEAELKEHSDARFDRLESELARQTKADAMKTRIIVAAVGLGAMVWAWAALR